MHFYAKDENGNIQPKHFVPMAKDPSRTRPSRTTDAKKAAKNGEIWYSSVTTVLNVLDKPALVNWKIDKHLEQIYMQGLDAKNYNDLDQFKKAVKAATSEELDKAPKAGTDIHQVLEDNLEAVDLSHLPEVEQLIVKNVRELLIENCGGFAGFDYEKYFINEQYGYAGCADLSDNIWVIDYKSKQTNDAFKKAKQYPEHHRQLAAYSEALNPNQSFVTKKCANIFVCLETGEASFHESTQEQLENGWLDFKDCLAIHQRNTYNPKEV